MNEGKWLAAWVLTVALLLTATVWSVLKTNSENEAKGEFLYACMMRDGVYFTTEKPWKCLHYFTGAPLPVNVPEAGK